MSKKEISEKPKPKNIFDAIAEQSTEDAVPAFQTVSCPACHESILIETRTSYWAVSHTCQKCKNEWSSSFMTAVPNVHRTDHEDPFEPMDQDLGGSFRDPFRNH